MSKHQLSIASASHFLWGFLETNEKCFYIAHFFKK